MHSAGLLSVFIFPAISLGLLRDKAAPPFPEQARREPTTSVTM
jgi:hypothetical protein